MIISLTFSALTQLVKMGCRSSIYIYMKSEVFEKKTKRQQSAVEFSLDKISLKTEMVVNNGKPDYMAANL